MPLSFSGTVSIFTKGLVQSCNHTWIVTIYIQVLCNNGDCVSLLLSKKASKDFLGLLLDFLQSDGLDLSLFNRCFKEYSSLATIGRFPCLLEQILALLLHLPLGLSPTPTCRTWRFSLRFVTWSYSGSTLQFDLVPDSLTNSISEMM